MNSAYYEVTHDSELPLYYIIEPTNVCNFKCIMCPNKYYKQNQLGSMDFSLFCELVKQIKDHAVYIQLYWMGEPLLSVDIYKMIKHIKEKTKAKVILSTNGSLLTDEATKELKEANLDTIIISIDAIFSQNTYGNIRVGGVLERTLKNVECFLEANTGIATRLQMISFKINEHDREELSKRFNGYSFTKTISWLDTWAGQFPELSELSNDLSPNSFTERQPCSDLWYKASIHWDGRVSICCHDWAYKEVIGDLRFQTMREIWNSSKMQEYRNLHTNREFEAITLCKNCIEWATPDEYNEFL